jgi:hypothetical protein
VRHDGPGYGAPPAGLDRPWDVHALRLAVGTVNECEVCGTVSDLWTDGDRTLCGECWHDD